MTYYGLSKSKIAAFEQCPKRLWLSVHRPELTIIDASTQAKFDAGHAVGEIACERYPDGIMIEAVPDMNAAIARTAELLALDPPLPLFEATFRHENVLVRVDLMLPAGDGRWHVAEVKSSTSAKPYQLSDLATQVWVMKACGVEIASASIRHIDNGFVYLVEGDYRGLLTDALSDDAIAPILIDRPEMAKAASATLQGEEPAIEPGDHCANPFDCPFTGYCNQGRVLPEWPISLLPNSGKQLARKWAEQGIIELVELAETDLKNELHRRIHRATITSDHYHDADGAKAAVAGWEQPPSYLDFETISFAVPRWVGTKPYQQVPFQFSVHVRQGNGSFVHRKFLDLTGEDPRRRCAEALIELVPPAGAIIAYNASFELTRIRELAAAFPDLESGLMGIAGRIVDLHPVTKAHYYHRDQRGSWSIKAVLPTIAPELSYSGLEVAGGDAAQLAYMEAIGPDISPARRNEIEAALTQYCKRDTWAMVVLHARLTGEPVPSNHSLAA